MTTLNDLLHMLELGSLKGVLSALVLPPVPFIVLVLFGAVMLRRKRVLLGWSCTVLACVALWMSCTPVMGWLLMQSLVKPPPALSAGAVADLKAVAPAQKTAIVVLGAGREVFAPEYGLSNLNSLGVDRLRYGIWLSKATGLPLAYSGGIGHGAPEGATESEIATRIAANEFGRPLRWTESRSRDTNENALYSVPMLREAGIERIVLVTHGFHMRRALHAFERAAQRQGTALAILPAPMDMSTGSRSWLPGADGFFQVRMAFREWLGYLAGA